MTALVWWIVGTVVLFVAVRLRRYPWGMSLFAPLWPLAPAMLLTLAIIARARKDTTYDLP